MHHLGWVVAEHNFDKICLRENQHLESRPGVWACELIVFLYESTLKIHCYCAKLWLSIEPLPQTSGLHLLRTQSAGLHWKLCPLDLERSPPSSKAKRITAPDAPVEEPAKSSMRCCGKARKTS
jgi:hypothetical protein